MPLYTDQGYYYSGGGSQLYAPYYAPSLYTISSATSSSGSYAPYSSTYNRTFGGSYAIPSTSPRTSSYTSPHSLSSRYKPKLSTITETSPLISARHGGILPLTRIQSPKILTYSAPTPRATKYIPPRPILINTADIDVSSSRYLHHKHDHEADNVAQMAREEKSGSVEKKEKSIGGTDEKPKVEERERRSTIKRDRPVVRLSTIRSRTIERNRATKPLSSGTDESSPETKSRALTDLPSIEPLPTGETHIGWRQKLAEDLAAVSIYPAKKSPGDLIRERYLIQDATANEPGFATSENTAMKPDPLVDEVVVKLDLSSQSIRRLSIPQCPTFHDICEDISSDKIDDDLNAGELRRRASIIQEQEQEILNQLPSGSFQLIHLERQDSQENSTEEGYRHSMSKRQSKKNKRIRHTITAVVEIENTPLLPILQEKEEQIATPADKESSPKRRFTFSVESVEEHNEVHEVFKLPTKKIIKKTTKAKEVVLPEGFMQASPKKKTVPKPITPKKQTLASTAEIFTFEPSSIEFSNETATKKKLSVKKMAPKHNEEAILPILVSTISLDSAPAKVPKSGAENTPVHIIADSKEPMSPTICHVDTSSKGLKSLDATINIPKGSDTTTKALKGLDINKKGSSKNEQPEDIPLVPEEKKQTAVEILNSGEDFWDQIAKRETLYRKGQAEHQPHKREEILLPQAAETVKSIEEIKSAATSQKKPDLKKADGNIVKGNEKGVVGVVGSQSSEPKLNNKDQKGQKKEKEVEKIGQQRSTQKILETEYPKSTATTNAVTISTSATSGPTKINSGQSAKSPEQQPNKFTAQADNSNIDRQKISISQAITTNTVTAAATTTTPTTQKILPAKQLTIFAEQNAAKSEKLANTPATTKPKVVTTNSSTTTPTAGPTTVTETKKPEVHIKKQPNVNTKSAIGGIKSDKTKTSSAITITTTIIPNSGANENFAVKPKAANTVTTSAAKVSLPTAATAASVNNSNAFPRNAPAATINADQFISIVPPKATTSPAKPKTTSPQITKSKPTTTPNNANEKAAKTKIPATVATTPTITIAPTPLEATTAAAITTTTTATTTKTPAATSPMTSTAATTTVSVASEALARCKSLDDAEVGENNQYQQAHAGNNLSKFATVQNLAQCLQDVDADLEDYIPSSAENSDDDDSSYDYSSAGGCDYQNLSASMKKKLRQRRKKEKQAEQARFDPQKKIKIDPSNKCYVKEEAPRYPLVATPRPLWKREKIVYPEEDSDDESGDSDESGSGSEETEDSEECTTSEEYEDDLSATASGAATGSNVSKENSAIIRLSTCSNDSGFEGGTAPSSPKKMLETSYTYSQFQKSGRFTAPATVIPRFKNYSVDDFHFLAVLGKGSFGKVLLAELRDTTYYYAVKCLKKDVVLEDDDVDSTLIERKVLALGTKHPYLCHLFCTFQTESHLFFVMEYLNGGDLMFHIQESGRFPEERARFYGAEITSGLKFLHKKGIIYRDLKLDNVLLDYEGHVRIADFGMCKLQIYLDKTADSFCGTPDYMAPEIIKGEKYNQYVDWWSFGVLLYEMLIGQSPFSGCDEDELFWSICNEIPWFPVYISAEATGILRGLLEKDYTKRIGSQYSPAGDISDHIFFRPIDWDLLEKRQLQPPLKPLVKHPLDTQYFDRVFTKERVRLTPIEKEILQSMDQKPFLGFTYTNPHITLD